jgi:hypothetical protein
MSVPSNTPVRENSSWITAIAFCSGSSRHSGRRTPAPPVPSRRNISTSSSAVAASDTSGVVAKIRLRRGGRASSSMFTGPASTPSTTTNANSATIGRPRGPNTLGSFENRPDQPAPASPIIVPEGA